MCALGEAVVGPLGPLMGVLDKTSSHYGVRLENEKYPTLRLFFVQTAIH